jgi:hypothetical protein
MALSDRVKSVALRAKKQYTAGLTNTSFSGWSAGSFSGAPSMSISVTGSGPSIKGTITSDVIFGHDEIRYGTVGNSYSWGYIGQTFYDAIKTPTTTSASSQTPANLPGTVVNFSGGQTYTTLKTYKDGLTYPIGLQNLVSLRAVNTQNNSGGTFNSSRAILVRATMSTPPMNVNDVFGLGVNTRVGNNIIGPNGRDGPTGSTYTYTHGVGTYMETFAHLRYYGEIASNPAAIGGINLSCNKGNFANNSGANLGTSVNFAAVRYQPPPLPLGQTTTAVLTMTVNLHGYFAQSTVTVTVIGNGNAAGGISVPGPNIEPTEKTYGLSILSPAGKVRFQADADDAIAQHVRTQTVNASTSTQTITNLTGCNNTNSVAVCAEDVPNGNWALDAEASPAMGFTSTGTLAVRGGAIPHSVSVLRIKGASTNASTSYGMEISDKNGTTVLDDGELGLGVTNEIFFQESDWLTFLSYSVLTVTFNTTYTAAPLCGIRTDKNLFVSRPYCYNPGFQNGQYTALRVLAPGSVASSGSVLIMAPNNQKANLVQYPNEDYGMQIFSSSGATVFDTRQRIAAVTDIVDVNQFTTGSTISGGKNIVSGKTGIVSRSLDLTTNDGNVHTSNQIVNQSINGNPAKDFLCMNGVIGLDTTKLDFVGYEKWGLCARFNPNSQGIQLQNNYIGTVIAAQTNSHPEGRMLIVRSY